MTNDLISDDAVEAAAVAIHANSAFSENASWEDETIDVKALFRSDARAALDAALPVLRARRVKVDALYGYTLGWEDAVEVVMAEVRCCADTLVTEDDDKGHDLVAAVLERAAAIATRASGPA